MLGSSLFYAFGFQYLGPVSITNDFPEVESDEDIRCCAVIGIEKLGPYTAEKWETVSSYTSQSGQVMGTAGFSFLSDS